jgi:hypothetical protein
MTSTDLSLAEWQAECRWALPRWQTLFVGTSLFVACGFWLAVRTLGSLPYWTTDYDRGRYIEISRAIDADPRQLVDRRFDEVSRTLRLEDVPWDDVALQSEPGSVRLYHFRGFSLEIMLGRYPPEITPDDKAPWSISVEELNRRGVLWTAHQPPWLQIDGIADRKERMRRFWRDVEESCKRINAEMERKRRGVDQGADDPGPDR